MFLSARWSTHLTTRVGAILTRSFRFTTAMTNVLTIVIDQVHIYARYICSGSTSDDAGEVSRWLLFEGEVFAGV